MGFNSAFKELKKSQSKGHVNTDVTESRNSPQKQSIINHLQSLLDFQSKDARQQSRMALHYNKFNELNPVPTSESMLLISVILLGN
jgi:hypothetical protein